jgi:tRNA G26 N,N-dimethylase Trm1
MNAFHCMLGSSFSLLHLLLVLFVLHSVLCFVRHTPLPEERRDSVMHEGGLFILDSDVFYSSFQQVHRDTTLLILKELLLATRHLKNNSLNHSRPPPLRFLDLFCGNGVRSLRFLKEIGAEYGDDDGIDVVGIDSQMECVNIATKTAMLNQLSKHSQYVCHKVTPTGQPLHDQLPGLGLFHVIDVDPFGSSIPYVQQCLSLLHDNGLLLLTCTDSRELFAGNSKHASRKNETFRTYGILRPGSSLACHEFGLRSAVTAACLAVRTEGRYPSVVASWSFSHGCRLIIRVQKNPSYDTEKSDWFPLLSVPPAMEEVAPDKEEEDEEDEEKGDITAVSWSLPLSHVYINASSTVALVGEVCEEGTLGCSADPPRQEQEQEQRQEQGDGWRRVGPLWAAATANCEVLRAVIRANTDPDSDSTGATGAAATGTATGIIPGAATSTGTATATSTSTATAIATTPGTTIVTATATAAAASSTACATSDIRSDRATASNAPALLLLERLLEENSIFENNDSRWKGGGTCERPHIIDETSGLNIIYCWGVYSACGLLMCSSKRLPKSSGDICRYLNINQPISNCTSTQIYQDHKHFKVSKLHVYMYVTTTTTQLMYNTVLFQKPSI